MLWTPHILAGAAIASKISNPLISLPLVLLSHYILDSLPQEEYSVENITEKRWNKILPDLAKVSLDTIFGLSLILLFGKGGVLIFIAAFLAVVPDSITVLSKLFPSNKLFFFHQKIHLALNSIFYSGGRKAPFYFGVISQIAVILTAIFILRE